MPELYSSLPLAPMVYRYAAYGVSIRSDAPLPLPAPAISGLFEIEVHNSNGPLDSSIEGPSIHGTSIQSPSIRGKIGFERNPSTAFDVASLPGGSSHVRMPGVGEISVSPDGRSVACHRYAESTSESFNVYLVTQALSFALVKCGLEPLHATAVAIDGKAALFLGDCGLGKSTLAAAFLEAGYRLLSDDLLVLHKPHAALLAYPGSPRIKLFPPMARKFLGQAVAGVPMNPYTHKMIVPLKEWQVCTDALPVGAVYALAPASEVRGAEVSFSPMSQREAFLTLLASTFNRTILDSTRLRRQFEATQALANTLPVKKLFYPRSLDSLPAVLEFVVSDLCAEKSEVVCGA
jgi:hypothetical protein